MVDYKKELLLSLVKRYNHLRVMTLDSDDDRYLAGLGLRAAEVRFLIEDLFGAGSIVVSSKFLTHMSVSED